MSLELGTTLAYSVTAKIGEGGMGRCIEPEAQLANNLTPAACKEVAPESELGERHD